MVLGGTAAAAGIALINAIGNLGGAVGPAVMGWLREATASYTAGLLVLACVLILEAALVISLRLPGRGAGLTVPQPVAPPRRPSAAGV